MIGARAHLRAPPLNMMAVVYGRSLSWIASACLEVLVTVPVDRVTPERLLAAFPERDGHKCRRLIVENKLVLLREPRGHDYSW